MTALAPRLLLQLRAAVWFALVGFTGCATTTTPSLPPTTYAGEAFTPSSEVVAPIRLSDRPKYEFPAHMPLQETWLLAEIEYVVDTTGHVAAARVLSTNNPRHAALVLRWLATAEFLPGRNIDHPVAVRVVENFNVSYGPVQNQ